MHTVDIGRWKLVVSPDYVKFAAAELPAAEIEALTVIRTDTYLSGAWVEGMRVIVLRGTSRSLRIDCTQSFPNRDDLDKHFADVFEPIWAVVGSRLLKQFLSKLANGAAVCIGGARVDRDGVWVDGSWKLLWWKAPPKLIAWPDLRIFSSEGSLLLESISDVRYRSEVKFNNTENAIVLDAAIRSLLHDNNWRTLRKPSR
jgi:hypothetical protein